MSVYSERRVTVVSDDGEWISEGTDPAGLGGVILLVNADATVGYRGLTFLFGLPPLELLDASRVD